ncbi:MAG TPA: M67 family metallopeptidase [Gemmataceae bacterium]|nr:M67 family metallopeptidase [Gemmataceae bacterium]
MPPFTRLVVPDLILDEMIAHARRELPNECCGLLAGAIDGDAGRVSALFPITNDAASPTEYATNPRDLLNAFRSMREGNGEPLAFYHSHPSSAAVPSAKDVARNTYGETVVHVIVGLAGDAPEVRAWWLTESGYRAAELTAECDTRSTQT